MHESNWGDQIVHSLAVKAGAPYGSEVTKVVSEIMEGEAQGRWVLEFWTAFEVTTVDGEEQVHYLPGGLRQLLEDAVRNSITIEIEEF